MTPLVYLMAMPGANLDLAILGNIFLFASGSSMTAQAHAHSQALKNALMNSLSRQSIASPFYSYKVLHFFLTFQNIYVVKYILWLAML